MELEEVGAVAVVLEEDVVEALAEGEQVRCFQLHEVFDVDGLVEVESPSILRLHCLARVVPLQQIELVEEPRLQLAQLRQGQ